jgi:hypothetical protein
MAWDLLLKSDIGLLSLFTIGFVIVMGAWLGRYAIQKMAEDERNAH